MPRPRLTIRDAFWLAIVIALAVGWSLEHQRASRLAQAESEYPPLKDLSQAQPHTRLDGQQRTDLVAALSTIGPKPIAIFDLGNNRQSRQYSEDFANAFKEANWNIATAGNFLMGPPISGLTLVVPTQGDDPLARAFVSCGIPVKLVSSTGTAYQLRVGR